MELIRQPIFLLLMSASALFIAFLSSISYFGFGDEPRLVKDSVLAVMLLTGLLAAVLSASNSLAREIRTGTALAVLAKPVGRAQFLLAKYVGLALALALLAYVDVVACLLASRMAFDAYGDTDWIALGIFAACFVIAYAMGGFSNFFLRRPFVSDAVLSVAVMVTVAFVIINFISKEGTTQAWGVGIDWRMATGRSAGPVRVLGAGGAGAGVFNAAGGDRHAGGLFRVFPAGVDVGLSVWPAGRRGLVVGEYLLWGAAELAVAVAGGRAGGRQTNPGTLYWIGGGILVAYVGAALALALFLFEDRELS